MSGEGPSLQWVSLLAAGLAGTLALIGVVMGSRAQQAIARESRRHERQLEELRRSMDQEQQARTLVDRYQEPLVRAAYDLQSRLWNILRRQFLSAYVGDRGAPGWQYATHSTAWLFGQYFGWVEIMRREAQFLSLPTAQDRRLLQDALGSVAHVSSTDEGSFGPFFQVFRSDQRAMGELMIVQGRDAHGQDRTDCMGFAAFSYQLRDADSQIALWFAPLLQSAEGLVMDPALDRRLRALQHALVDLVTLIDPDGVRFPRDRDYA